MIIPNRKPKINGSVALRATASALVLMMTVCICRFDARCDTVRKNVLRLHISANSDSAEDQALKLSVRDRLLELTDEVFADCKSESEAAEAARNAVALFRSEAEREITENGYSYPVTVEVSDVWFETREYESFTLPAGVYEAVRVVIGSGEGHNWWCVMFPAICLPAVTDSEGRLNEALGDQCSEIVTSKKRYKAEFKVVEVFERVKLRLKDIF